MATPGAESAVDDCPVVTVFVIVTVAASLRCCRAVPGSTTASATSTSSTATDRVSTRSSTSTRAADDCAGLPRSPSTCSPSSTTAVLPLLGLLLPCQRRADAEVDVFAEELKFFDIGDDVIAQYLQVDHRFPSFTTHEHEVRHSELVSISCLI